MPDGVGLRPMREARVLKPLGGWENSVVVVAAPTVVGALSLTTARLTTAFATKSCAWWARIFLVLGVRSKDWAWDRVRHRENDCREHV